ncbi:MAG: YqgE/AlgH family protein [Flavobacteriales bacterium]
MNNPHFNKTVILLVEHGQGGSIGFIVNKPLHFCIYELVTILKIDFTL